MHIDIIPFQKAYSNDFYSLNKEWLQTYFYVEPFDEEVLSKPKKYLIEPGGHIFFVKMKDTIIGTVALMPTTKTAVYELTKMAVAPKYRGLKIGQHLMQHCLEFSRKHAFKELILYSNRKLENAIYIYRKFGFIEVPVEENSPYKRSDIKMTLKL